MTNREFKDALNKLLNPHGFKKNGSEWTLDTTELIKGVYLQKSNFGNSFYLNYGYNFKDLNYDGTKYHIFGGLGSSDGKINTAIQRTFDLENSMDDLDRTSSLSDFINDILLGELNSVNNVTDILNMLKSRPTLNDIPLKVKQYLSI